MAEKVPPYAPTVGPPPTGYKAYTPSTTKRQLVVTDRMKRFRRAFAESVADIGYFIGGALIGVMIGAVVTGLVLLVWTLAGWPQ